MDLCEAVSHTVTVGAALDEVLALLLQRAAPRQVGESIDKLPVIFSVVSDFSTILVQAARDFVARVQHATSAGAVAADYLKGARAQ